MFHLKSEEGTDIPSSVFSFSSSLCKCRAEGCASVLQMIALAGEVEAMGDMFTRMNRQCYQKCCNQRILDGMDYNDELSLDDERCLESCATKFMATQHMVGAIFMSEAQAEQSKMEQ